MFRKEVFCFLFLVFSFKLIHPFTVNTSSVSVYIHRVVSETRPIALLESLVFFINKHLININSIKFHEAVTISSLLHHSVSKVCFPDRIWCTQECTQRTNQTANSKILKVVARKVYIRIRSIWDDMMPKHVVAKKGYTEALLIYHKYGSTFTKYLLSNITPDHKHCVRRFCTHTTYAHN